MDDKICGFWYLDKGTVVQPNLAYLNKESRIISGSEVDALIR